VNNQKNETLSGQKIYQQYSRCPVIPLRANCESVGFAGIFQQLQGLATDRVKRGIDASAKVGCSKNATKEAAAGGRFGPWLPRFRKLEGTEV
jgi:hypothetical protein